MRENGTDRDIALSMLSALTNINTAISTINNNLFNPIIITQPTDVHDAVLGTTVSFTVVAANVATYQWQSRNASGGGWTDSSLSGYNTATLSPEVTENRYNIIYRCKLLSTQGNRVDTVEVRMYPPET